MVVMKVPEEVKIAIVTALCLIANAIVFKTVLYIQINYYVLYSPLWVFIVYMITRTVKPEYDDTIYWALIIVIVTILTILAYAY